MFFYPEEITDRKIAVTIGVPYKNTDGSTLEELSELRKNSKISNSVFGKYPGITFEEEHHMDGKIVEKQLGHITIIEDRVHLMRLIS